MENNNYLDSNNKITKLIFFLSVASLVITIAIPLIKLETFLGLCPCKLNFLAYAWILWGVNMLLSGMNYCIIMFKDQNKIISVRINKLLMVLNLSCFLTAYIMLIVFITILLKII